MEVRLGADRIEVVVLQYLMRSMCALLAFGPSYSGVPKQFVPPVELQRYSCTFGWGDENLVNDLFRKGARNVTSFFSRAYNNPNPPNGQSQITNAERQLTTEAVDCILGHFGIVQEPPWVDNDDWVEQLRTDLDQALTLDAWQKIECKWATLVSYSAGLRLHQGPWAGPNWQRFCNLGEFSEAGDE